MIAYILLADGFECMEVIAPIDVFRRAKVKITTVSLSETLIVTASNGVEIKADATLGDVDVLSGDALILPGGYPGYVNLSNNDAVGRAARLYYETHRLLGAICGAPVVLQRYGIGKGSRITCHRTVKDQMTDFQYTGADVERDGQLVTAIGAGHALDFALTLLNILCGPEFVEKVKPGLEIK